MDESKNEASNSKKAKLRSEFDALHAEMEVATYARSRDGRSRRKISRQESKVRTIKRKTLEVADAKKSAVRGNHNKKRMRGSRAALEDDVIQSSLIFDSTSKTVQNDSDGSEYILSDQDEDEDSNDEDLQNLVENGNDNAEEEGRYELYADELNIDIGVYDNGDSSDEDVSPKKSNPKANKSSSTPSRSTRDKASNQKFSGKKIGKTMYKLKNFTSFKMAQKHGEALGAHARGLNISAVAKLREVADAAPIAPQIYSSLGLVYESMLRDETEKAKRELNNVSKGDKQGQGVEKRALEDQESLVPKEKNSSLHERIKLAKKTFASYHVAALLCKMDYSLWVRAGDAALNIAHLHSLSSASPPDPDYETAETEINGDEYVKFHQAERKRWVEEAKKDFQSADNLHPPGISVPCKLAHMQMELGNVSEALTILTDLKNKSQVESDKASAAGEKIKTELDRSFSAWLLYADLMLIIGHECIQWNRGIQTNDNYMFRRWLRKYSENFDWQERRFQALFKALEAAAGTKSCEALVLWVQQRTLEQKSNDGKKDDEANWEVCENYDVRQLQKEKASSTKDDTHTDENIASNPTTGDSESSTNIDDGNAMVEYLNATKDLSRKFNDDRECLLAKQQSELLKFDADTRELNLKDDSSSITKREAIMKRHKQEIISLAVTFQENNELLKQRGFSKHAESEIGKELEIAASCAVVCDIASQLVKLCLAMNMNHGGRLVCETVSLYLKKRAKMHEDRSMKWKLYDETHALNGKSILQLNREAYDTLPNGDSDDEDSIIILSDEEDFDLPEGDELISVMRDGVLTPELQVLYGLSLISEGKSTYLATKLLSAMADFEDSEDLAFPTSNNEDSSFFLFRRTMAEPMNKLDAFAFSSDVLKKAQKEDDWVHKLLPIFQDYLEDLDKDDSLNLLDVNTTPQTIQLSLKRKNYVKLLFSTFRMKISKARSVIMTVETPNKSEGLKLSMSIVDDILKNQDALWSIKTDGNPTPDSIELLDILSHAFSVAISCLEVDNLNYGLDLSSVLRKLKACVSLVCQIDFSSLYSYTSVMLSENWRYFPIPSAWQTDENTIMSRSAYNLCVGCSVSSFSGWERDEFTLNLLKKTRKETFFGVNIQGERVAGIFPPPSASGVIHYDIETHLSELWKHVEVLVPTLTSMDFENAAANAKKMDWYKKALENLESHKNVAVFGENSALNILFIFARVSLLLARHEENSTKSEALLRHALSIILPTTQFYLDQSLWDSELGIKGTDETSEWQIFSAGESTFTPKARSRSSQKKNPLSKPIQQYKSSNSNKLAGSTYSSRSPFKKLIKVSVEIMLREWNGKELFEDSDEDDDIIDRRLNKWSNNVSGPSMLAMKKLDYSILKLRHCLTITSLQKASLQVALALLEVADQKECRNPFLCWSQAAVYATQGSKGGNNDEEFKKPIPRETSCTPKEALRVLGRADCLRAIHFINEAIFLCSFATRVCCLHRDKKETEHPWTPKWRVVGIMCYTVSVSIDSIIMSLMDGEDRKLALDSWDKTVKAEIGRGRSDAIAMQKAFGRSRSSISRNALSTTKDDDQVADDDEEDSLNTDEDIEEDEELPEDRKEDEDMPEEEIGETHDDIASEFMAYQATQDEGNLEVPPLPPVQNDIDYTNVPTVEL